MNEPIIVIEDVYKSFGHVKAVSGVSTTIDQGEVVIIIGPSGGGKSTLLRCINNLEQIDSGRIVIDGVSITEAPNINEVRTEIGIRSPIACASIFRCKGGY